MTKGATMWTRDGTKMVHIVERLADGRTGSVVNYPVKDKAEALAIAKRECAKFTA